MLIISYLKGSGIVYLTTFIFLLSACGGSSGGGGGGDVCADPTVNAAGSWQITETITNNNCGEGVRDPYTLEVAQTGSSISVYSPSIDRTFTGKICGNTLTWSGSYPEDGGTTTITSVTATVSGKSLGSSSSWSWTDGVDSCSGTTSSTGTRTSGGEDGGGDGDQGGDTGPVFTGFDFELMQGDFWEFQWDYYKNSWAQGSGGSTIRDIGRFRITLEAPINIDGVTTYPIQFSGRTGYSDPTDFSPRWNYIAMNGNQILGSVDGSTLSVIFDAQNGIWPSGGFFCNFDANSLVTASNGAINNNYINNSAIEADRSASESQCDYFPGIGNICGDESFDYSEVDYFIPDVGPVGYRYYNTFSDCGGGFCSGATWETNIGLVLGSLLGDTADYELENEPNDSYPTPQALANEVIVLGDIDESDAGTLYTISGYTPNPIIQDFFTFTLPQSWLTMGVFISIDFSGTPGTTDLDLFLFNSNTTQLIDSSWGDNAQSGVQRESINQSLGTGTYVIGVNAFNTDSSVSGGRVEYTIKVSW